MEDFSSLWKALPTNFDKGTDPITEQVGAEFEEVMQNYTKGDIQCDEERKRGLVKNKMKQELIGIFDKLKVAWAMPFEIPETE
jgi:hypothetical protein